MDHPPESLSDSAIESVSDWHAGWRARASLAALAAGRGLLFAARRAGDMVLPPRCAVSGFPVSQHGDLAPSVWQRLHFIDAPFCRLCGLPWEAEMDGQEICAACAAGEESHRSLTGARGLDMVRAALAYDDLSSQLALRLKYADRLDMAPGLARLMRRAGSELLTPEAILVPVPLHRRRLISRRYNQAGVLAAALSRQAGCPAALDLLVRTRATPRQKGLSAKGRARNVKGAFAVRERWRDEVKGARIVLIDDVLTTGATLKACAAKLKRAGAVHVGALVLARVVPDGIGAILP